MSIVSNWPSRADVSGFSLVQLNGLTLGLRSGRRKFFRYVRRLCRGGPKPRSTAHRVTQVRGGRYCLLPGAVGVRGLRPAEHVGRPGAGAGWLRRVNRRHFSRYKKQVAVRKTRMATQLFDGWDIGDSWRQVWLNQTASPAAWSPQTQLPAASSQRHSSPNRIQNLGP